MDKNSKKTQSKMNTISSIGKNFAGSEFMSKAKEFMGKLSRGLMLPIAVLPIAGLFLGIGGSIVGYPGVSDGVKTFGNFLKIPGDVVFGNLPVLFAISIAIAFTDDSGIAGLSALLGWAVFNGTQSSLMEQTPSGYDILYWKNVPNSAIGANMGIQSMQTSVFGGIIVGWVVSKLYWRFNETQLPSIIGFFSGSRFVLVMTFLTMIPMGIFTLMIWPGIGIGLEQFGKALGQAPGGVNSLVFGFFERILVPFGLHHAFYTPLWTTSVGGSMDLAGTTFEIGSSGGVEWTSTLISEFQILLGIDGITGADKVTDALGVVQGKNVTWLQVIVNKNNLTDYVSIEYGINKDISKTVLNPNTTINGDQLIWMAVYGMSPNSMATEHFGIDVITYDNVKTSFDGVNPGQYMQGKFSFMIFGLPAAGAAMIMAADKENRKDAAAIIASASATAFLTGITEPIEFTFLFLAPWVFFGPHAIMCALSFMLANVLGANMGMTFSGGIIDFVIYGAIPDALGKGVNSWVPVVVGLAYAPIYYFGFYFLITKFNIETPGRGSNISSEIKLFSKADVKGKKVKKGSAAEKAPSVLEALGGKDNIKDVDACITKLRVTIKTKSKVKEADLKALGAKGIIWITKDHVHALFGTEADPLKTQIKKLLK